ncbi:MAG: hypothetical protein ACRC1P_00640 [Cellulosilyticaceae bacterium]
MNNLLIVRIYFPSISANDKKTLHNLLHILTQFTLKPFVETAYPLKCYIQISEEIEPLVSEYLSLTSPLPNYILFTSKPLRDVIRNELDTLTSEYDFFYFFNLSYNTFCHKDFLTTLSQYIPNLPIRSLLVKGYTQYNLSTHTMKLYEDAILNQFIYVCSVEEYQMYFRIYDYYYPATLNQKFKLFPSLDLFNNTCTTIHYQSSSSTLPNLTEIDYFHSN